MMPRVVPSGSVRPLPAWFDSILPMPASRCHGIPQLGVEACSDSSALR